MSENEIIPIHDVPETAQEKFERERLTRRQALKRFGMTAGMAAFAMFSVDDLAHIVGKAMQQRAGDNKVASQVAEEFQQAGIAFAGGTSNPCYSSNPSGSLCTPNCDCSGCNPNALNSCCSGSNYPFVCCAKSSQKASCCGYVVNQINPGGDNTALYLQCLFGLSY